MRAVLSLTVWVQCSKDRRSKESSDGLVTDLYTIFRQEIQVTCIININTAFNHFYYPTNALNYIKLWGYNVCCVSFKRQLKITPTCFGSCVIHHHGVLSCAWLKLLLVVHRYFLCAWSVFGSVILNLLYVCTVWWAGNYFPARHTMHTHSRFKITLPNTDQAHEKYLWTTKSNFSQTQLSTPWWWIAHNPKHVGVTFNCLLKLTKRRF